MVRFLDMNLISSTSLACLVPLYHGYLARLVWWYLPEYG